MSLSENFERIQSQMAAAAQRVGRKSNDLIFIGVTKGVSKAAMQEAIELGLRHIGENRVQEAEEKFQHLHTDQRIRRHLIGHLQKNKVKRAVELFDMIQSVDSVDLAAELEKRAAALPKELPILLEVNVSGESTKFGFSPDRILQEISHLQNFPHLHVQGLMTIAPFSEQPEDSRPHFARLRRLRDGIANQRIPGIEMIHLSMGMSQDFEVAIEEGATMLRIGRALFGGLN